MHLELLTCCSPGRDDPIERQIKIQAQALALRACVDGSRPLARPVPPVAAVHWSPVLVIHVIEKRETNQGLGQSVTAYIICCLHAHCSPIHSVLVVVWSSVVDLEVYP